MTVKNDITSHIDTSLSAMSIANGYNYDWTDWNEFNVADRSYPQGFSTFVSSISEENQMSNKYTSQMTAMFRVIVDDTEDVDLMFSKVLEDVQRMFNDQHTTLKEKGMLTEKHSDVTEEYFLNKLRPGQISIGWDIRYRVSKDDPSST